MIDIFLKIIEVLFFGVLFFAVIFLVILMGLICQDVIKEICERRAEKKD
jgi:hypothetical protein